MNVTIHDEEKTRHGFFTMHCNMHHTGILMPGFYKWGVADVSDLDVTNR